MGYNCIKGYATNRNPSRRAPCRRAANDPDERCGIGTQSRSADEPGHTNSEWSALHYWRYRIAPCPFFWNESRILAQPAKLVRSAHRTTKVQTAVWELPRLKQSREVAHHFQVTGRLTTGSVISEVLRQKMDHAVFVLRRCATECGGVLGALHNPQFPRTASGLVNSLRVAAGNCVVPRSTD